MNKSMLPSDLVQVELEIADSLTIQRIDVAVLPRNWQSFPAPRALQRLGDDWLVSASTPVLQVPSAVIPEEHNLLINPQHADATRIAVVSTRDFTYDSRLRS